VAPDRLDRPSGYTGISITSAPPERSESTKYRQRFTVAAEQRSLTVHTGIKKVLQQLGVAFGAR